MYKKRGGGAGGGIREGALLVPESVGSDLRPSLSQPRSHIVTVPPVSRHQRFEKSDFFHKDQKKAAIKKPKVLPLAMKGTSRALGRPSSPRQ